MQIEIMFSAADCAGSSSVYTPIGRYLDLHLGQYGDALDRVQITMCLPTKAGTPSKLEARQFGQLPRTFFRRKRKAMEIEWLSQTAVAADEDTRAVSTEKCNRAMPEIASILSQIAGNLKRDDDFDFETFIADVNRLLKKPFSSIAQIEEIENTARKKEIAERQRRDPWESTDLDWDKACYHPGSRAVLDQPFFWSLGDEFSPHGNDTGADVLSIYAKWRPRTKNQSPFLLITKILNDWQIHRIDEADMDEDLAYELFQKDENQYRVCNQVTIAIAFAELKYKATCPPDLAVAAIASIRLMDFPFMHHQIGRPFKSSYRNSLSAMRSKLECFMKRARTPSKRRLS